MSSKKVESKVESVEAPAPETIKPTEEELLTDEEISEAVGETAIAVVEERELEPIETLDFEIEGEEAYTQLGLTRGELMEMNARAETVVTVEEILKDHHRERIQREKGNNARKKLAALKSKPDAIAQLVKQITAVN